MNFKSSFGSGLISGTLGALCCVTPLVLVFIGLSSVSGAIALSGKLATSYRWTLFIPLAILFLMASIYFHIKKNEKQCTLKQIKSYKVYILTTFIIALIVWVALLYLIVPMIFGWIS